jgi:hypothetical protein
MIVREVSTKFFRISLSRKHSLKLYAACLVATASNATDVMALVQKRPLSSWDRAIDTGLILINAQDVRCVSNNALATQSK